MNNKSLKIQFSMFLTMVTIVPAILIIVSTAWFLYVEGLPDMINLRLATRNAFWISLISIVCGIGNWLFLIRAMYKN